MHLAADSANNELEYDTYQFPLHHDDSEALNESLNTSLKFAEPTLDYSADSEQDVGFNPYRSGSSNVPDLDNLLKDSTVNSTNPPSVPESSVPGFEGPSGERSLEFEQGNNDEANDSDLDELNCLKRRRESNDSDRSMDSPIQKAAKKQRGIKRFLNRPENVEALFEEIESDPSASSIIRIGKSTRQPKNGNGVTHVLDVLVDGQEFRLNQSDVSSSGLIRFLCSKRKYDPRKETKQSRCKGGCDVILRDLGIVDERKVSNRTKFFVKRELTIEDVKITQTMNHCCTEKSLTERYEDSLTEKSIQLVKRQKENQLNHRRILPGDILEQVIEECRQNMPKADYDAIKAQGDKVNTRRIVDRLTRELRSDDPTDRPINTSNRFEFRDYPLEFYSGNYKFDEDFATESNNESWLFYEQEGLKQLDSIDNGVAIQDNTFCFGSRQQNGPDLRHFKIVWKLRLIKNGVNQLIAFAAMSRQTAAAFQKLFERLSLANNGMLKAQFLVMDRQSLK